MSILLEEDRLISIGHNSVDLGTYDGLRFLEMQRKDRLSMNLCGEDYIENSLHSRGKQL